MTTENYIGADRVLDVRELGVPACLIYFCGILGLFARWHGEGGNAAIIPESTFTKAIKEQPHVR